MSSEGIGGFFLNAPTVEVWSVEERRKIGEVPSVVRTESLDGREIVLHRADGISVSMKNGGGGGVYTRSCSGTP